MQNVEPNPVQSPLHYLLSRAKPLTLLAAGLLCGFAASGALYPPNALGTYRPDAGTWLQLALFAGLIHALLFLAIRCIDDIVDLDSDRENGRWSSSIDPRRSLYPLAAIFTLAALALAVSQSPWAALACAISLALLSLPRLPAILKLPIATAASTATAILLADARYAKPLEELLQGTSSAADWRSIILYAAWLFASLVSLQMIKGRREGAPKWLPGLFGLFIASSGLLLAGLPWIR